MLIFKGSELHIASPICQHKVRRLTSIGCRLRGGVTPEDVRALLKNVDPAEVSPHDYTLRNGQRYFENIRLP